MGFSTVSLLKPGEMFGMHIYVGLSSIDVKKNKKNI